MVISPFLFWAILTLTLLVMVSAVSLTITLGYYRLRCLYLTEIFLLDAAGDGLYCTSDYYSLLLNYQMRCLHLTAIPLLSVGADVGFL